MKWGMVAVILALGGCQQRSFDDHWQAQADAAQAAASSMEADAQVRLKTARTAGQDGPAGGLVASSGD